MIVFTVAGLFKDIDEDTEELRYFQRQYIIVPAGSGFCIRNELVLITVVAQQQVRFFKKKIETATSPQLNNEALGASSGLSNSLQNRLHINQPSVSIPDILVFVLVVIFYFADLRNCNTAIATGRH